MAVKSRMEVKLDKMMEEFHQLKSDKLEESKRDMDKKFADFITKLKHKTSAAQERTSQQLTKTIGLSMHQFRQKGHQHHYNFNCGVEDAIASARSELAKVKPTDLSLVEAVRKADMSLDEGSKALIT